MTDPEHLRASHCKPRRDSSNEKRLDGEYGLLLAPSIDHLFDRGFISFDKFGQVLISPVAHKPSLERLGVRTEEPVNVGAFGSRQRQFLEWYQEFVFLTVAPRMTRRPQPTLYIWRAKGTDVTYATSRNGVEVIVLSTGVQYADCLVSMSGPKRWLLQGL